MHFPPGKPYQQKRDKNALTGNAQNHAARSIAAFYFLSAAFLTAVTSAFNSFFTSSSSPSNTRFKIIVDGKTHISFCLYFRV
jgi:hypothetical protein